MIKVTFYNYIRHYDKVYRSHFPICELRVPLLWNLSINGCEKSLKYMTNIWEDLLPRHETIFRLPSWPILSEVTLPRGATFPFDRNFAGKNFSVELGWLSWSWDKLIMGHSWNEKAVMQLFLIALWDIMASQGTVSIWCLRRGSWQYNLDW